MSSWNPLVLWRCYFVTCPSGVERMVYRRPDDAFPSHVAGFQADLSGNIDTEFLQQANISAKYRNNVHALLFQLDELNGDLILLFRAAYVLYQTDPCQNYGKLTRSIQDITTRHQRLKALKLVITNYVQTIRNDADPLQLAQAFVELANGLQLAGDQPVAAALGLSKTAVQKLTERQ